MRKADNESLSRRWTDSLSWQKSSTEMSQGADGRDMDAWPPSGLLGSTPGSAPAVHRDPGRQESAAPKPAQQPRGDGCTHGASPGATQSLGSCPRSGTWQRACSGVVAGTSIHQVRQTCPWPPRSWRCRSVKSRIAHGKAMRCKCRTRRAPSLFFFFPFSLLGESRAFRWIR